MIYDLKKDFMSITYFEKRISRSLYASLSARGPSIELKNFNLKVLVYKPLLSCCTQKFLSCSTELVLKLRIHNLSRQSPTTCEQFLKLLYILRNGLVLVLNLS